MDKKADVSAISAKTIAQVIDELGNSNSGTNKSLMEKGVKHAANLWRGSDGSEEDFKTFCKENYISDQAERETCFSKRFQETSRLSPVISTKLLLSYWNRCT